MNILVFDIETIPDIDAGRKLYHLSNLSDSSVAEAMFAIRREKTGNDFLPHYLQKIVAISLVLVKGEQIRVWSLGDTHSEESDIISRFFSGIDKHVSTLVSWNGTGFDLPVLHYRALLHGISAPTYWEYGEKHQAFKWNNYLNRYHYRHLDLMDILSGYQPKAVAPLDDIATLLGFPGKMGVHGSKVWEAFQNGDITGIRNYCETDVLNTYCVFLKFEKMRGNLNESSYQDEIERLKTYLESQSSKSHLQEFLEKMASS